MVYGLAKAPPEGDQKVMWVRSSGDQTAFPRPPGSAEGQPPPAPRGPRRPPRRAHRPPAGPPRPPPPDPPPEPAAPCPNPPLPPSRRPAHPPPPGLYQRGPRQQPTSTGP